MPAVILSILSIVKEFIPKAVQNPTAVKEAAQDNPKAIFVGFLTASLTLAASYGYSVSAEWQDFLTTGCAVVAFMFALSKKAQ